MTTPDDAVLFAQLRDLWRDVDPIPASLVDRMVAVVATADLASEYALLTLVEHDQAVVRGDADTLTLQFSDGITSILLHVTVRPSGGHRLDGWVDTAADEIVLAQGPRISTTVPTETGRFVFDNVPSGMTAVRLTTTIHDETRTLSTPQFEL